RLPKDFFAVDNMRADESAGNGARILPRALMKGASREAVIELPARRAFRGKAQRAHRILHLDVDRFGQKILLKPIDFFQRHALQNRAAQKLSISALWIMEALRISDQRVG